MVHKNSEETYEFIADFIDPAFFYSRKDVFHRMGMLGVFGEYVLSCTPGEVLEIGCGESSIYLSHLARKHNRLIYHCDAAPDKILNPLTVAGYMLEYAPAVVPPGPFVEFGPSKFYMGKSDDMFRDIAVKPLALSFIDGDHVYDQALKDFENVFALTVDHGYILLHDTYPPEDSYLSEHRCGNVYLLRQEIEQRLDCDCITLTKGTAMGVGLTIVRKKPAEKVFYHE